MKANTPSSGRVVDGPAAYYVDILHFLRDRGIIESIVRKDGKISKVKYVQHMVDGKQVTKNTKDILFARRPDLGEIELNCANTNTPVPYVDLCIEILEEAVNPQSKFDSFNLPATAVADLDAAKIGDWGSSFTPPLSEYATVTVLMNGESWTIDELNFSYGIRKQDDGPIKVLTRSRQTKGTAAERAATPQYQNSAAYEKLAQQVFPVSLPFDMWTKTIRTYLAHITVSRNQIMEVCSKSPRIDQLNDPTISYEVLGLTVEVAEIITNATTGQPGSPASGPWSFWGFKKENEDGSNKIPDPASASPLRLSGMWDQNLLSRVDLFLQQGSLEYRELLNILQFVGFLRPLESESGSPAIQARQGEPQDTCELKRLEIVGLSAEDLRNIHALVRLCRHLASLGWSMLEVGQAYAYLGNRTSSSDTFIASPKEFLIKISHVQRLRTMLDGVSIAAMLAFWAPISPFVFRDYDDDSGLSSTQSLYAKVFRDNIISTNVSPSFLEDPAELSGSIANYQDLLIASLNISASDLSLLKSPLILANDELNLRNLSQLYRHSVLANGLGVSLPSYIILLELVESNPFSSTATTVDFVERAQNLLNSDFSLQDLNYLLRHDFEVTSSIQPTDVDISSFFEALREEQQRIEADNAHPSENTLEQDVTLIRKKVSELGLDESVVTQAVSILDGTTSSTVSLPSLPPDSLATSSMGDKCIYNPETKLLTYSGTMTLADQQTLKALPGASAAFTDAVQSLFDMPRTFLKRYLGAFSPVEVQTPLSTMPTTFSLPIGLRKKLYYDQNTSNLHCIGALAPSELQTLSKAMSKSEPATVADFKAALDKLAKASETVPTTTENTFLISDDISKLFDTTVMDGAPIDSQKRILYVLEMLLPAMLTIQARQAIIAGLSQTVSLEARTCQILASEWLHVGNKLLFDLFLIESLRTSSSLTPITRSLYPQQFDA